MSEKDARTTVIKSLVLAFLIFFSPPVLAGWKRVSDITLGTAVVGSIAGMKTWEKRGVATLGHLANFGVNYGLKHLIRQDRPDGSDSLGMPSGHSQTAMFGAGLLCREYGALPCAGGVGLGLTTMLGRYKARRHSLEQVSVGGMLGLAGGYYGVTLSGVW